MLRHLGVVLAHVGHEAAVHAQNHEHVHLSTAQKRVSLGHDWLAAELMRSQTLEARYAPIEPRGVVAIWGRYPKTVPLVSGR